MPHTKGAKKRLRQTTKRRERNRDTMKQLKVQIKTLLRVNKDRDSTPELLQEHFVKAVKRIDKAAAKRVIHPNQAARKKSQLARLMNERNKPAAS